MNGAGTSPARELALSTSAPELELTFRDPAGELWLEAGCALRRIRPAAEEETRAFLASPLRKSLEQSGDLISTRVAYPSEHSRVAAGELWLEHPRIDPISYPWEWSTGQWRAAAELTLRIAGQAIDAGWTLKDATPLNILFSGPRPVLVDVLSFERRDRHSSVWLAYGQFVRTFLLPLVAAKYLSWPLAATLFARDGYEPRQIYEALPRWRRLNPKLLDVVTLATVFERTGKARASSGQAGSKTNPDLARHVLKKRLARLAKQIEHAAGERSQSQWSRYAQTASHYKAADVEEKQQFVKSVLAQCRPQRVLDIGANTGAYSLLATDAGASVVALDNDGAALERLWQRALEREQPITALVADIARPTPAAGWRNREHLSLLDRLTSGFDMVLMLAVVHHLILRHQLPLGHIAGLCASLTRRWLLLEWVPPSDPMFQEWLRGRDDLYGHLTEDDLRNSFVPYFGVVDRAALGNGRVLLLFDRLLGQDHIGIEAEFQSAGGGKE
ncbi:MAG TPA: class I SAM-dependent methyltransferase [Terracidiphilus sp.]|nr:class I SAM-dependent methyltransferase [Terracidiphilus sp.]